MKPGIITQARTGSTRLPGKVLKTIQGKTLLEYHLERLEKTGLSVVVATSELQQDDPIVELCEELEVPVWRGAEQDVLNRYLGASEKYRVDPVIRATSDCPLIDPDLLQYGLEKFQKEELDYLDASHSESSTLPHGMNFHIMSHEQLRIADEQTTRPLDREHVVPFISRKNDIKRNEFEIDGKYNWIRITVDYPEDFELVSKIIREYKAHELDWQEIVGLFKNNPSLLEINEEWNDQFTAGPSEQ